jgi:hypothetical protein
VKAILRQSRPNNINHGISGLLAYADGIFLQALEGEQATVESLYARIAADPRHTNVQVVHQGHIDERVYPAWGMGSAFRLGAMADRADRIALLRSRFSQDSLALSADYFRFMLTPSRLSHDKQRAGVRRVGIFASSALWFTPVFNAIADMSGVKPNSVLVSAPDVVASDFAVDYIDTNYKDEGAVRTTGFSKDLLSSPLIAPFLNGMDLLVVLMRRSDIEANIEQLKNVLSLNEVREAKPDVICIAPSMDEAFSLDLIALGQSFGVKVNTASASLLMGNDVLSIIKRWLSKTQLSSNAAAPGVKLALADKLTTSVAIEPTMPAMPAIAAVNNNAKPLQNQPPNRDQPQWLALALSRIMLLPGAKQSFFINTTTAEVIAAETQQLDANTRQLMVATIVDKFALMHKIGLNDEVNEMVTTLTTRYEIVARLSSQFSIALFTVFDREATLLASVMPQIRSVIKECEYVCEH